MAGKRKYTGSVNFVRGEGSVLICLLLSYAVN